jgi:hypothetical protein
VIHGLADELLDRLAKLDGLAKPHLTINDGITAQAYDISTYKIAADELVVSSGARILFHALAVGVVMADDDRMVGRPERPGGRENRRGPRRVEVGSRRGSWSDVHRRVRRR